MARRQPANKTAGAGTGISTSEDSGEGNGKVTPSPRPHDSVTPVPVTIPELENKIGDSHLIAPEMSATSSSGIPGTVVPAYVYPFGWHRSDVRRFIGLSIAGIIALVFLWYVQSILPPFLIAFFLAALFEPTIRELERHGRTRVRAILTLYLAALCLVGIVAFIVVPRVVNQATDISSNLTVYSSEVIQSVNKLIKRPSELLGKVGLDQPKISALIQSKAGTIQQTLYNALSGIMGSLAGLASRALWLVIIPLATFFFMRDYPVLRARIITQFPERYHERIDIMSREVMDVFSAYLRGLAKICSIYSVVAIVLYSILGLRYALILGIFVGIFYAVPYVGQLFTAVGTGLVAYLMDDHTLLFFIHLHLPSHSFVYALFVVVMAVIVQNVFDQILYPRIVGGSVGLHPVASIFALMSGATLFGIWGMLLAVPVAASIQIIIMYFFPKVRMAPPEALLNTESPTA